MAQAAANLHIFETGQQRCGCSSTVLVELSSLAAPTLPSDEGTVADHGMDHEQGVAALTRWCASLRVCSACQPAVSMIGSDQVFFAAATGVGEG